MLPPYHLRRRKLIAVIPSSREEIARFLRDLGIIVAGIIGILALARFVIAVLTG